MVNLPDVWVGFLSDKWKVKVYIYIYVFLSDYDEGTGGIFLGKLLSFTNQNQSHLGIISLIN